MLYAPAKHKQYTSDSVGMSSLHVATSFTLIPSQLHVVLSLVGRLGSVNRIVAMCFGIAC